METPIVKRVRGRGKPKTPPNPPIARMWEYTTLNSERPLMRIEYNVLGAEGWELVAVYVRMDAVHAVFKREVV